MNNVVFISIVQPSDSVMYTFFQILSHHSLLQDIEKFPVLYSRSLLFIYFTYVHAHSLSRVQLFVTPWAVACQMSLSMGLSSKKTGVGCHFLLQGIFLTQGLNHHLPSLLYWQAESLPLSHLGSPVLHIVVYIC